MTLKHLTIANEALMSYQGRDFFTSVCELLTRYCAKPVSRQADLDFAAELDQRIAHFTGILCQTRVETEHDKECYMCTPLVAGNHALAKDFYAPEHLALSGVDAMHGRIEGYIDGNRSRVEGGFTKLKHLMVISRKYLRDARMEKVATRIIHEVGHGYSFLAYTATTLARAVHIEACHQKLLSEKDPGKFKLIVDHTRQKMGMGPSKAITQEIVNKEEVFSVAALELTEDILQKDPRAVYTYDTAEELADIFTTRHGCARYLADMRLDDDEQRGRTFFQRQRLPMLALVVLAILPTSAITMPLLAITGASVSLDTIVQLISPSQSSAEQSVSNIRNELIAMLKQRGLQDKQLLEEIDYVTAQLTKAREQFNRDYGREFLRALVPGVSLKQRIANYQAALGAMAHNELFVAAARLRASAK